MFTRRVSLEFLAATFLLCASSADAQVLQRHVAEFRFGGEQFSNVSAVAFPGPPDGVQIYTRNFALPATQRTVFITLSTTGDAHEGVSHWFSARLNARPCSPLGGGADGAPAAWISLQKHFDYENITYRSNGVGGLSGGDGGGGNGDMHDNGIYYTWCCLENVQPGAINVAEIRMATSNAGDPVFVEDSHYYVDSVDAKLCNAAGPVSTPVPVPVPGPVPTSLTDPVAKNAQPNR